jgi:phage shock protein A
MPSQFQNLLEVAAMPSNAVFLTLMLVLASIDLITYYLVARGKYHRNFKGEIVGLGILGTFFGIFAGLQHFDPSVLRTDLTPIVKLLDGLKIAFLTSIAGMALALGLTVLQALFPSPEAWRVDKPLETLLKDILEQMRALRSDMREESSATRAAMDQSFKTMNEALQQALQKLSEGASKEIIAALEQVIRDFNHNLTKQFGENFKELNAACLKLLEWQDRYKTFVEQTGTFLTQIFASVEKTEQSLHKIGERNAEFLEVSQKLGDLLSISNSQLARLNEHLTKEAALYTNAEAALAAAQTNFAVVSKEIGEGFRNVEVRHKELISTLTDQMRAHYTEVANSLADCCKQIENFSTKIQGSVTSQAAALSELTTKTADITTKARNEMDEALRQMENALTSVTQQFGDKYRQFISQVERLVNQ